MHSTNKIFRLSLRLIQLAVAILILGLGAYGETLPPPTLVAKKKNGNVH